MNIKCIETHIVETMATGLEHGEKFVKQFEILEGATGTAVVELENNRIMIRLDENIIALNESDSPYISMLYRTFIPLEGNPAWEIIADTKDKKEEVMARIKRYNPKYGDNRICTCGHHYHRHFDSYEDMEPCGCKYCACKEFKELI